MPAPHDDLALLSPLASSASRCAWAATSERHPGSLVVVLFLRQPPGDTTGDRGSRRYVIALDPRKGWLPCAVVTALPAPLPEPFDDFELLSFVGLGPSGSIWMAESPSYPDAPLAVKFLDRYPELDRPDVRERFLEAAVASIQINSSFLLPTLNVLDLHKHRAKGWAPVALVSWLQEPSLQRVLDDLKAAGGRLPEGTAGELLRHLFHGLRELHGAYGLVHRDVKPSNILLRLPGERPYHGPESLGNARALLGDFTTACRVGLHPLLSAVQAGGGRKLPAAVEQTSSSLGTPATNEEDWRGFLGVVAAVVEVTDDAFGAKVGRLPEESSAAAAAEAVYLRLFPDEDRGLAAIAPPQQVPSEERGLWRAAKHPPSPAPSQTQPRAAGTKHAAAIEVPGYEVVGMLGCGGMGEVYLAIQLSLRRKVAIKVLRHFYHSPHAVARLHVEANAIARLYHPNIVHVYETGVLRDGLPYISMEYLPGGSLREWPLCPTTLRERAALGRVLALAVAHAHRMGVIHRDLKPANVLFGESGQPKIIDFGLAKLVEEEEGLTGPGQVMGTPTYMAPEQARGDSSAIGPGVDVYGLGCLLYWLLTERAPFGGIHREGLLNCVLNQDPTPPRAVRPDIPRDLEAICLKCLEKNPDYRYASAEQLADELERFLKSEPIRARRTRPLERVWRWCQRNPVVTLLTSLLLVITVTFTAAATFALRELREALHHEQVLEAVANAESAIDRGQLAKALSLFDEALQVVPAGQRPAIEVKRLRCLFAYGHRDELQKELDRLAGRDDLPDDLRAQVLLDRGDVGLCDPAPERQEAARDLIRGALDVPNGLGDADAAYARGLLDESTFDAVRHFEEALRHQPFHQRANGALLMELVLSGHFERAERRAEFMAAAFPGEPVTPLALALRATLQEDAAARARHLAELRRVVADPERMAVLEAAFAALDDAIGANHRMHGPNKGSAWFTLPARGTLAGSLALATALKQMRQGVNPLQGLVAPDVVGVGLPVRSRPARMVEEMAQAYEKLAAGDAAEAAALLGAAEKKYPESLLRLIDATAHLNLAQVRLRQGDLEGCFRESRRAHALAEEAADAPTLIPFGPYRHNARWLCVMVEVAWGAQYRSDSARLAIAALAPGATNPLGAAVTLAAGQDRLKTYPLRKDRRHLLHVAVGGGAFDEARSDLLPQLLHYFEDDDARLLLKDWARAAPKDPLPFRLLSSFEMGRRNFGEALRWAELGLVEHPSDPELRPTRDRARKALGSAAREEK